MNKMTIRLTAASGSVTDVADDKTYEVNMNDKKERRLVTEVAKRIVEVGK